MNNEKSSQTKINKNNEINNTSKISFTSFINEKKVDLAFILLISIFSLILVYLLIGINNQLGIYCSDVFIYLINSLNFAGEHIGKTTTLYLSPTICFLTSLFFRAGFVNQTAIFTVTGSFFTLGAIGLYLLFKTKLNEIMSLFGTILFCSFSLNLLWTANGSLDIPAIAISIWIMYFTILAIDKNPCYFLIALPLFVLGFFTRFTVGFILPLMILYGLFKIDIINKIPFITENIILFLKHPLKTIRHYSNSIKIFLKELKNTNNLKELSNFLKKNPTICITIGIIISLIIVIIILTTITSMGSDLTFITQTQDAVSGGKGLTNDPGYKPDPYFYITNLPNFISSNNIIFDGSIPILSNPSILGYFIIFLMGIGGLTYISRLFLNKNNKNNNNNNNNNNTNNTNNNDNDNDNSKKVINSLDNSNNKLNNKLTKIISNNLTKIKIISAITISLIIIITYKEISSIISEVFFLLDILLVYNIFNNYKSKYKSFERGSSKKSSEILKTHQFNDLNFNLMMFSWFIIYLIFFSFSNIKVDRYFITMLPAIAYFSAYSLDYILNTLKNINKNNKNKINKINKINNYNTSNNRDEINNHTTLNNNDILNKWNIIPIILILIFAISSFSHIAAIPTHNEATNDPIVVSNWLKNYDHEYESKIIWTYSKRPYTWYLKTNDVGAYEKDIPKLEKNNVSYYIVKDISDENYIIPNYTIIKKYKNIYIYERVNQ